VPGSLTRSEIGRICVTLLFLAASLILLSPDPAAAGVVSANATADSYVRSDWNANFGSSTLLYTRSASPIARTYLRFSIPGVTAKVTKATLRVYTQGPTSYGLEVRTVTGAWEESTLRYSNAPAVGPVVARTAAFPSNTWVSIDVTAAVTSGSVDLALTTTSTGFVPVSSRETAQPPQLSVQTGTTYYVDAVAGSDASSGTSPSAAWKSVAKVSSAVLAPGDTVLFNRGNVWAGTLSLQRNGTAADRISFGAYGSGALPIIRGGESCVYVFGSYMTLTDLQVEECAWGGIDIHGSNNRVERNVITKNAAGVVLNSGANSNVVLTNEIRDNNRMSVLTAQPTNDDSGAFGVVIAGDDNEIAHNSITGSFAISYDYGTDGAAIEIYGGQRNLIHHNKASGNDTFAELGHSRSADNTFAYNTIVNSLETAIFFVTRGASDYFGPVLRTNLHNNSTNLSGSKAQGVVCYAGCSTDILIMRNNIIRALGKGVYADGPFVQTNNLFSGGSIQILQPILALIDPIVSVLDPGYVNAAAGDLHLNSLSQAIDKGLELGYKTDHDQLPVPIDGNSDGVTVPDIGAYEYRP
jgi:hypothetical protein